MKLKWQQAPVKTQWGDEMAVASVAIDNDHTLSLYCERDQVPKVDAMFAQRQARSANTWVHATTWRRLTDAMVVEAARMLSDRQAAACNVDCGDMWKLHGNDFIDDARAALEAAHGIKENT